MTKQISYIILANAISLFVKGDQYVIEQTHPNYTLILDALKAGEYANIDSLVDIPKSIVTASSGAVEVKDGQIFYRGKPVYTYLATKILELMSGGFNVSPWVNFMNKLYDNPSATSIKELYPFLEKGKLPICPDGDFLAYKYVRKDYKDCHSGTFDNSVGTTPTMLRGEVDDNRSRTCSAGLHFCSKDYLPAYGNHTTYRVMIVKVNPANVVSIPADHNDQKARCWTYEVVGEIGEDYEIEDMEDKPVLEEPRNTKKINSTAVAKVDTKLVDKIVAYWNKHRKECETPNCPITVRQVAKAIKGNNSDVTANAGTKYFVKARKNKSLSDALVVVSRSYRE